MPEKIGTWDRAPRTSACTPAVAARDTAAPSDADACASQTGTPCDVSNEALRAAAQAGVELRCDDRGLFLAADDMDLRVDLADELPRLRPANLARELLVRAAKTKGVETPFAVDATAGLGADSLLLAAAGFHVLLFESDLVIAALLRDALRRAADDPALAPIANRMQLIEGDSIAGLHTLAHDGATARPDVVYLDPMFPERTKSAAVKKKFQLLHRLERPCENPEALLEAACAAHPRKIVIKRPAKGPHLAGVKPSYSLSGKAVRYDVIALPPVANVVETR